MNAAVSEVPKSPFAIADLDQITDFYVWDVEDLEESLRTSSMFVGESAARPVHGTEVEDWLRGLLYHVREKHHKADDFRVEYRYRDEIYLYRGHRDRTVLHPILCLRRHPTIAPMLDDLALPRHWRELFLHQRLLRGGLIVIAAVTGQGKSTTIAAAVKSRLHRYAGFCRTIEDPPELPLHGTHGHGICIQTPVDPEHGRDGFAHSLRSALRSYPALPSGGTICVVGEVRDGETAAELLRASVNGHLVITTVHANDVNSALSRLAAMAGGAMGEVMARDLLGQGLVYAIHQTLTFDPKETGWKRGRIGGDLLASFANNSSVASLVRDGQFTKINQEVETQRNILRNVASAQEFITRITPGSAGAQ